MRAAFFVYPHRTPHRYQLTLEGFILIAQKSRPHAFAYG